MGWSLSGILGAAMVGGGAAAERNFVDERKNEAAIAKAKELAVFEADLRMEREQRVEEAKAARAAKLEFQNRESDATNFELAKDYAINELKAKPGTVEFYEGTADFLNRSGRKDLAKDMLAEANRIRTDDTKDQIAAARAAGRGGSGGGRGGSGDSEAGKIDIDAALTNIAKIGVSTKDGEAKADPGAFAVANSFFNQAFASTKNEKRALDATRTMMIRTYEYAQDNGVSLREASKAIVGKITGDQKTKAEKARVEREKATLQFPEEAPESSDPTERNINFLKNQGTPAADEKESTLGWWE